MGDKTFLEFVEDFRLPMIPDDFGFAQRVKFLGGSASDAGKAEFLNKKGVKVDEFDFGPFFPTDDGRTKVERAEAGMYFFYRAAVRKGRLELDHGFKPYPKPEPGVYSHWPFGVDD